MWVQCSGREQIDCSRSDERVTNLWWLLSVEWA